MRVIIGFLGNGSVLPAYFLENPETRRQTPLVSLGGVLVTNCLINEIAAPQGQCFLVRFIKRTKLYKDVGISDLLPRRANVFGSFFKKNRMI
jgi:hypothetical protein